MEETNSRITEAEDRISEVEDGLVEINEAERKKGKRMKRNENNLRRPLGQCQMPQHSNHKNSRRRKQKRKVMRKYLKKIIVENVLKWGRK